ncbi:MAG: hypothetical protein FJX55_10640 [Alphaproteobacteria bacterium]|nr:hypothetical protein [Alphaproteobacteria bacterium]
MQADTPIVGNIVSLEHVNIRVPDQLLATLFYVTGLGLTRDPYLMTGLNNMWINIGRSQFHLPTGDPQILRGHVGLVIPDRRALLRRLAGIQTRLKDTRFTFREQADHIEVMSPWGNLLRCFEPEPRFGATRLGLPYVEFDVPVGSAAGIARFYQEIFATPASAAEGTARVTVGPHQSLIFRETDQYVPDYDGHHVQVYVRDFAGVRERLGRFALVSEDNGPHQYRFLDIIDLDQRRNLFTVEHEIRSLTHPLHARPLVNRNPAQTNLDYVPGADALAAETLA